MKKSSGSFFSQMFLMVTLLTIGSVTAYANGCVDDLTATPEGGDIRLNWSDAGADHYNVYRSLTSGGPYVLLGSVTTNTFLDSTAVAGSTYYYVIREAELGGNELCQSNETSETASSIISVTIDIKPGSDPNAVNPTSQGVIPVAILGSAEFDVTNVDVTTLAFGNGGATPRHKQGGHFGYVNDDAFLDLLSHFGTQDSGIAAGDTEACLTGELIGGTLFEGCDSVQTVPRPQIPDAVLEAISDWFDGFQAEGNTAMILSGFSDGWEYGGCTTLASIGFDRSFGDGNTFFAYLTIPSFTVVAEVTALDPRLESPIKAAVEAEAVERGVSFGACP
jgi:hypothetical protein